MSSREKILSWLVGGLLGLFVLKVAFDRIYSAFTTRYDQIAAKEQELKKAESIVDRGQRARKQLDGFEQRSLPPNSDIASQVYRAWLVQISGEAGIASATLTPTQNKPFGDQKDMLLGFKLNGQGTLEQVTKLLYGFYRQDFLHRIESLTLTPTKDDTGRLIIDMTIAALALAKAPESDALPQLEPSTRLRSAVLEDYTKLIVTRNIFSRGNTKPKFGESKTQELVLGRAGELQFRADPADANQKIASYRILKWPFGPNPPDPSSSGTFHLTPDKLGEYEVEVEAQDNGAPPNNVTTQLVKVVVKEPKAETPAPLFDESTVARFTGFVEVSGRAQTWLRIPTTDERFYLVEGDEFTVGKVTGTVRTITQRGVEFEAGGQRYSVRIGQKLAEAQVMARNDSTPASE